MAALTRIVRGHPILVFAVLACLFGWGSYIAELLGVGSHPDNMPLGPLMAAFVVTACQGRTELRAWGRQLRSWRATPGWYAVAVLAPALLHVAIVLVNHLLGAPLPTGAQLASWPDVPITFVAMLLLVGIGEEAGWTAFAAPLLMRRHGLVAAWLVVSAIRITWHLPLMLSGEMPWVMGIVGNAAFTMVALQVLVASRGGWQLVAVWHASLNAFGGAFFFTMVTGDDQARLGLLLAAAYAVLAVVLVAVSRARQTSTGAARRPQPAALTGSG